MTFVSAWSPQVGTVIYKADDGTESVRQNGSRSWRNCNPGNIQKGSFADSCGAIGGDSRFAIFPDEATGLEAIATLLRSRSYRSLTLQQAIFRYAPTNENDSNAYVQSVVERTGVSPDEIIARLSLAQLNGIALAIQVHEGWIPGTEAAAVARAQRLRASAELTGLTFAAEATAAPAAQSAYVYEQATGRLYLRRDGSLDLEAFGYSGSEVGGGKNNPDAQCRQDVGPLPRGDYQIGGPIMGPSPYSLPLTPASTNDMCGRSGFLIHGDSIAAPGRASHGCIILARPARERIVASGIDKLIVVARLS
ncbi:tlde1 domain-containing protein [Methylobacterium sp. JK268]